MTIDVAVRRVIPLPPERVAGYAMDWRHDAEWTQGIRTAELTRQADDGGFGAGAEVTRTARFLGRRIDYVLRVAAYEPPRLLDMVSVVAPMPMHAELRTFYGSRQQQIPAEVREIMRRSGQELADSGQADRALAVGDRAPRWRQPPLPRRSGRARVG